MCKQLIVLLWVLIAAGAALADGKVFGRVGSDPTIPDQQALIHYDGRVQTLAIETRFAGEGTEFAWVVPLPSVPEVSAATTGLFPTVEAVFRPSLIGPPVEGLQFVLLLLLLLTVVVVLGAARKWRIVKLLVISIGMVLVAGVIFLPALGKARGGDSAGASAVTVHDRRIVGDFETITISSDEGGAIVEWLSENGFATPAAAEPAIAAYVDEGWVFVATRLARPEARGVSTPHPLIFQFKTDRCIYPMRLTGAQSEPVELELFVFASGSARAPGMRVRRSSKVGIKPGEVAVVHEGLAAAVGSAEVGTHLRGVLSQRQMQQDLVIEIGGFRPKGAALFARDSARLLGINAGLVVLVIAIGVVASPSGRKRDLNASVSWLGVPLLIAVAAGGAVYAALPKTGNIEYGKWRPVHVGHEHNAWTILAAIEDRRMEDPSFVLHVDEVRSIARQVIESQQPERWQFRHEDSPGNYIIRERDGKLVYVWFDEVGREQDVSWQVLYDPEGSGGG